MIVCLLALGVAAAIAVVIVVLLLRRRQAGRQNKLNGFDNVFYEKQVVQSTMGSINGNSFNLQPIRDTKDDKGDSGHYEYATIPAADGAYVDMNVSEFPTLSVCMVACSYKSRSL